MSNIPTAIVYCLWRSRAAEKLANFREPGFKLAE